MISNMMDTYHGHVRTPADAIKLFEACRLGLLPRVQRRLSEKERQAIKSGSVFVWDEREAGMKRWTDGKSWSASRVSGSFLTYREMEGKRGGGTFLPPPSRRYPGKTPDSGRGSSEDHEMDGDGPDGYRYKPDGLMKQSFSITTSAGQHLHLISYYSRPHPNSPELMQPTNDPQLRHIVPIKGMYPESTVHENGPPVTRTPMSQSPYLAVNQHRPQPHHSPNQRGGQQYYPGYSWPPSPVSTPPYPGYGPPVYNSNLPPPPPQPTHQSPYTQPGSNHNSPYQNQHGQPHAPMSQLPPHQQQTAYDRPPPPLSDASLPPPPPSGPRGMSTATAINTLPNYVPNPSPRVAQARLIAEQQAVAARALQASLLQQQQPMLDPRLTNPTPSAPSTNLPPVQSNGIPRTTTPPITQSTSQANTPQSTHESHQPLTSQAQSIPSISALVHATDSVSVISDNKSNSSRAGSRSPMEKTKDAVQNPRDIPHEKLNIGGEDQRAIRVLDRKFAF